MPCAGGRIGTEKRQSIAFDPAQIALAGSVLGLPQTNSFADDESPF
jgi:hypothetical protein